MVIMLEKFWNRSIRIKEIVLIFTWVLKHVQDYPTHKVSILFFYLLYDFQRTMHVELIGMIHKPSQIYA
jgi:hypothetical protein